MRASGIRVVRSIDVGSCSRNYSLLSSYLCFRLAFSSSVTEDGRRTSFSKQFNFFTESSSLKPCLMQAGWKYVCLRGPPVDFLRKSLVLTGFHTNRCASFAQIWLSDDVFRVRQLGSTNFAHSRLTRTSFHHILPSPVVANVIFSCVEAHFVQCELELESEESFALFRTVLLNLDAKRTNERTGFRPAILHDHYI